SCLYPSRTSLADHVDRSEYDGRPYSLKLALGAAQLEVRFFDLSVLERYRADPRFWFDCNDVGGHLSAHESVVQSGHLPEPERVPLFQAFVRELAVINEMCRAAGWPPLFREDFSKRERPTEFAFILRPTLAAFNSFIHLLDKVMSDNLSKEFFHAQGVALER